MKRKTKQDVPKTIGELRQRLAEQGNPWEVDPLLGDDEPLPDRPRGGQEGEEILPEHRLTPLEPSTTLRDLIATEPPTNPFLRARWAEVGMLAQEEVEGLAVGDTIITATESGEGEGGTA